MLQAFVITLREGLEAFLIIAISLAYLKKSGNRHLVPAVHWGILASILVSVVAGMAFARAANQALWEGVLAMAAALMVASLTVHMWCAGHRLKGEIEGHLRRSTLRVGTGAFLGVFGFTLLMITREGIETALMMNALLFQVQSVCSHLWRGGRDARGRGGRLALGAIRASSQPGSVLSGHSGLSPRLRDSVVHLRLPRAHRGQHLSLQRNAALGDRTVRTRRALRPVLHLSSWSPCRWVG